MIKAVLFDFDGVIADTLTYHVKAWQVVFREHGVKITNEDIAVEEGAKALEIAQILSIKNNLNLSEAELRERTLWKREVYRTITKAKVYPGIINFINTLKNNSIKLGLVTGSIVQQMKHVTGDDFLDNFDIIITSDDVKNTKPAPEPYIIAAKKLSLPPDECLVIENAPKGIRAAKEAGMKCIAVRTTIKNDDILSEADFIVDDVSQIVQKYFSYPVD